MPVQPDWLVVRGVSPAHGSVRVPPRGGGEPVRLLPGGILRLLIPRLQRCRTSEISRRFLTRNRESGGSPMTVQERNGTRPLFKVKLSFAGLLGRQPNLYDPRLASRGHCAVLLPLTSPENKNLIVK